MSRLGRDGWARIVRGMVRIAPRVADAVVGEIERLDDGWTPIAEICRAAGDAAARLGQPRPSYETVRTIVHRHRRHRGPSTTDVLLDVAFRVRPPEAILDHLSGVGVPDR